LSKKVIALYSKSYNILKIARDQVCLQSVYIYIYKIELVVLENINNSYIANANSKCK